MASAQPITLPPVLLASLRQHRETQTRERAEAGEQWNDHGLVFTTTHGTPIGARNLVRHFKLMLGRTGLPDVRFHDLRDSCATLLITLGVHPRIIMEILRHTQISTTMNLYGHVIPEVNRSALNSLGDLLKPQTLELPKRVKRDDENTR
jgi:integrase